MFVAHSGWCMPGALWREPAPAHRGCGLASGKRKASEERDAGDRHRRPRLVWWLQQLCVEKGASQCCLACTLAMDSRVQHQRCGTAAQLQGCKLRAARFGWTGYARARSAPLQAAHLKLCSAHLCNRTHCRWTHTARPFAKLRLQLRCVTVHVIAKHRGAAERVVSGGSGFRAVTCGLQFGGGRRFRERRKERPVDGISATRVIPSTTQQHASMQEGLKGAETGRTAQRLAELSLHMHAGRWSCATRSCRSWAQAQGPSPDAPTPSPCMPAGARAQGATEAGRMREVC